MPPKKRFNSGATGAAMKALQYKLDFPGFLPEVTVTTPTPKVLHRYSITNVPEMLKLGLPVTNYTVLTNGTMYKETPNTEGFPVMINRNGDNLLYLDPRYDMYMKAYNRFRK